jgi:hypothetical protein
MFSKKALSPMIIVRSEGVVTFDNICGVCGIEKFRENCIIDIDTDTYVEAMSNTSAGSKYKQTVKEIKRGAIIEKAKRKAKEVLYKLGIITQKV